MNTFHKNSPHFVMIPYTSWNDANERFVEQLPDKNYR